MTIHCNIKPLKREMVGKQLREDIVSGALPVGAKLPRGTELAERFGVSHITIRAVCAELAREGYVKLIHGRGTFVESAAPDTKRKIKLLVFQGVDLRLENPYNYILPEFCRRCQERGVVTETASIGFLREGDRELLLKHFGAGGYAGISLASGNYTGNEPELSLIRDLNLPVLLPHGVLRDAAVTGFPVIYYDQAKEWRKGIRHLAALGHRRIGVIQYAPHGGRVSDGEHNLILREFGCDTSPELIVQASLDGAAIRRSVARLLELKNAPTAIFCFSDFFAIFVYEAVKRAGLRIPEDISVLGFCGSPGGEFMSPPLSTIDLQYDAIGRFAADLLIDGKTGKGSRQIRTEGKLRLRKSTASIEFKPKQQGE